jgi:hypothetical protein
VLEGKWGVKGDKVHSLFESLAKAARVLVHDARYNLATTAGTPHCLYQRALTDASLHATRFRGSCVQELPRSAPPRCLRIQRPH